MDIAFDGPLKEAFLFIINIGTPEQPNPWTLVGTRALVASGASTGPNTLEPLGDSTETKVPDGGGPPGASGPLTT